MSYEIINKKQGGNNKLMNSTTGGGVLVATLTEDEYGEIDEDNGYDNNRQDSVLKSKTGRGNGHQQHKRMMKGSSI